MLAFGIICDTNNYDETPWMKEERKKERKRERKEDRSFNYQTKRPPNEFKSYLHSHVKVVQVLVV